MGSGKTSGGRQSDSLDQQIYEQFYNAGASGSDYNWLGSPDREEGARLGYEAGLASRPPEMPDYGSMFAGMMEGQANQLSSLQAQNAEAQAEAERTAYMGRIDQLYSSKFSAANAAVDSVDSTFQEMQSYANISGADFSIDPEDRKERINNQFATFWSAEQEAELAGLEKQWGSAGNKWTSGIVRGVASEEGEDEEKTPTSAGGRVNALGTQEDEEDTLGASGQVLGSS